MRCRHDSQFTGDLRINNNGFVTKHNMLTNKMIIAWMQNRRCSHVFAHDSSSPTPWILHIVHALHFRWEGWKFHGLYQRIHGVGDDIYIYSDWYVCSVFCNLLSLILLLSFFGHLAQPPPRGGSASRVGPRPPWHVGQNSLEAAPVWWPPPVVYALQFLVSGRHRTTSGLGAFALKLLAGILILLITAHVCEIAPNDDPICCRLGNSVPQRFDVLCAVVVRQCEDDVVLHCPNLLGPQGNFICPGNHSESQGLPPQIFVVTASGIPSGCQGK